LQSVVVVVVGKSIPLRAIIIKLKRSSPTRPAAPPLFDPYWDALRVGSKAEEALAEVGGANGGR
jgi:hypothetical protein